MSDGLHPERTDFACDKSARRNKQRKHTPTPFRLYVSSTSQPTIEIQDGSGNAGRVLIRSISQ